VGVRGQKIVDTARNSWIRVQGRADRDVVDDVTHTLDARHRLYGIDFLEDIVYASRQGHDTVMAPDPQAPRWEKRVCLQLLLDVGLHVRIAALSGPHRQPVRDPHDAHHILGNLRRDALLIVREDRAEQRDLAVLDVHGHLGQCQALIRGEGGAHRRGKLVIGGRGALLPRGYRLPPAYDEMVVNPDHIPDQTRVISGALPLIGRGDLTVQGDHALLDRGADGQASQIDIAAHGRDHITLDLCIRPGVWVLHHE